MFSTRCRYGGYTGPLMTLSLSDGRSADVFRNAGGTYRLSRRRLTLWFASSTTMAQTDPDWHRLLPYIGGLEVLVLMGDAVGHAEGFLQHMLECTMSEDDRTVPLLLCLENHVVGLSAPLLLQLCDRCPFLRMLNLPVPVRVDPASRTQLGREAPTRVVLHSETDRHLLWQLRLTDGARATTTLCVIWQGRCDFHRLLARVNALGRKIRSAPASRSFQNRSGKRTS